MFIYNVTINVEESIHTEWLKWMKEKHMPDVVSTGCFTESRILRVLADDAGATYSAQYSFKTMEDYERYRKEHAAGMQQQGFDKFGARFIAYRTLLQIVD
ncbi:MAG: hypothetical protein K0S33_931 [Bacteroidetes bacterium]|jgi:hypothetical protein|nr:hypothetical protein [Bacteroidota bacterium]